MQYRYFECKCGNKFHGFVNFSFSGTQETYKAGVLRVEESFKEPTLTCNKCGQEASICLNDPEALGTKLLFNYMER
jgi:hypothetical protein